VTRERIDNRREAERLADKYDPVKVRNVAANDGVGPRPIHGLAGTGMDGVEVDLDLLARAEKQLGDLHDDLTAQLTEAGRLLEPMSDGTGPVTRPMRRRFNRLADADGLLGALWDYRQELINVRMAILATLSSYRRVDSDAADRLRRQVAEIDEETFA
jgi:hypothetical protein